MTALDSSSEEDRSAAMSRWLTMNDNSSDDDDDASSLTGDTGELDRSKQTGRASSSSTSGTRRGSSSRVSEPMQVDDEASSPAKKKPKNRAPPKDLPPELAGFKYEFKHRLVIGEEMNLANKENPGPCHGWQGREAIL